VEVLEPLKRCPKCGRKVSEPQEWRARYIEEIILPHIHVTECGIPRSYCPNCDCMVEPRPDGILPKRQLGNKLRSYIVYLREELRLPVNMVQKHLDDFGVKVSEGTVENICSEAAEILKPHYQAMKEELGESKATNNDETGKRIEGETCWEWVFAKHDTAVFHSDRRRSHDVMEEFYGEHPKPVLGSDCYTAYNPLDAVKQRCWAHLLDGSSGLESEEGRALHEKLKSLYSLGKIMDKGPPSAREAKAQYCEDRLKNLVNSNWSDPETRRVVKLLKKHQGEWFNFVRYPEVEPTNNLAERVLRPEVVFRKIIGGHRSWNGARKHDILRSTLATCRLRGESFMGFLEEQYRKSITSQN
jgi:transposase